MKHWVQSVRKPVVFVLAGGLIMGMLAACGSPQAAASNDPIGRLVDAAPLPALPLGATAGTQQVAALMLHSHTLWQTLKADATLRVLNTLYNANTYSSFRQSIEVQQYGRVHLEEGLVNMPSTSAWISDNRTIWQVNLTRGTHSSAPLAQGFESMEAYSALWAARSKGVVISHPMAALIPSPMAPDLFPMALGQTLAARKVTSIGWDKVGGRDCIGLRVEDDSSAERPVVSAYWVDAATGVILRSQTLDPSSTPRWRVLDEVSIDHITYNGPISAAEFMVN